MATEYETTQAVCNHCGRQLEITSSYESGGVNDYGGVIVACDECGAETGIYIGRDYTTAHMVSGGRIVSRYDRDERIEADAAEGAKVLIAGRPPLPLPTLEEAVRYFEGQKQSVRELTTIVTDSGTKYDARAVLRLIRA